jgi:hypothetical protein
MLAIPRKKVEFVPMRILFLLAAAGFAATALPAEARGPRGLQMREQDAAYQAAQQGRILPLPSIRQRIRVPGAQFIGAEFDGVTYRLKYMRGSEVIWIDVDARTGRVIGRQ